ncbi:unnamed protein product [Leptosia nina]|uniref:tryptophan--tRNA ligase n=1 Tax=Leptosia nina TaxID=320188 RepID=A0AAV1JPQ5_9NEOP
MHRYYIHLYSRCQELLYSSQSTRKLSITIQMTLLKDVYRSVKKYFPFRSITSRGIPHESQVVVEQSDETSLQGDLKDEGNWPKRIVSGLQPTGALHIGNYFAAVRRCVQLQEHGHDVMLFIADLHALTTKQTFSIEEHTLDLTAYLMASGVDPARTILFSQSAVPRHAELCWVLTCLATQARLAHLPQYRERTAKGGELAAQLVRTFHHRYGRVFPTPRALLPVDGSDRIKSLRDPSKKMSKSDPDLKSRIMLSDSDENIHLKIRKAVTDFTPQVTFDPVSRPGVSNLVTLHCLAQDKLPEEVVQEVEGLTTAQYKRVVASALCDALGPVRSMATELRARPRLLRDVLKHGAARARLRADEVYGDVMSSLGLSSLSSRLITTSNTTRTLNARSR